MGPPRATAMHYFLYPFLFKNARVRASDHPDAPVAVGRDGTNDPSISVASYNQLFDKKVWLSSSLTGL